MNVVIAQHGVRNAVEVKRRLLILQLDLKNSGPLTALEETWHGALQQFGAIATAFLDKFAERPADDFLKRHLNEVGKTAVDCANLSVHGDGQQEIVEGVNQVTIALLRLGDDV